MRRERDSGNYVAGNPQDSFTSPPKSAGKQDSGGKSTPFFANF